ncbi:MAG: type II secretion system minor pseudopilin GspI [Steroidobacter sp.]
MRVDHRHGLAGFTLIEVAVALIVVSLGMLAVIETVGGSARNTSYMREKTVAHWVAMNKLTEVRLLPSAPALDKSSDEIEMAGRKWRWTMEAKQTPVESIRRIDISVRPAEAPDGSSMASVSGFFGTAVAPAGTAMIQWRGSPDGTGPGGRRGTRDGQQDQDGSNDNGNRPPPPQPEIEPGTPVDPPPETPPEPE